jgi:hypothetical protein
LDTFWRNFNFTILEISLLFWKNSRLVKNIFEIRSFTNFNLELFWIFRRSSIVSQ